MLSIGEIKGEFQAASVEELPELIKRYGEDQRSGVRQMVTSAGKKLAALEKEKARIEGLRVYEEKYGDCEFICGIDEAGRGPLAGPVVAGAVILPKNCRILYVNDSKLLTEKGERSFIPGSWKKQSAGEQGLFLRSASTRSIFCRPPTRRCGRQWESLILSRIFCLTTR